MAPQQLVNAAVVVDPYSSGRFLVYELASRQMPIICVRSTLKMGAYFLRVYDTHKEYYCETLDFEDFEEDVTQLVDRLRTLPYTITAVFGGSEPGVELADMLSEALGLSTANGTELMKARKDKAEMQERLRACNVPAADQFRSGELDELISWAVKRNEWPVVAKPTGSSGSDGVFFCQNVEDLTMAHGEIVGKLNPNGAMNSDIALQEFLAGDEYIVDTVSFEGKHLVVACWVYKKVRGLPWNQTAILSTQNQLLPPSGQKQDELISYVCRVLDAVGVKYGACHTEVMFTSRGPILVEVNNRMHGLQGPKLIELATGTSKATYLADVLAGDGELFRKCYVPEPDRYLYPVQKQCVQLILISPVEGYLKRPIQTVIAAMELPSVMEVCPAVQKGGFVRQTIDLPSSTGGVLMVHDSMELIEEDIRRIRKAEENGELYDVSVEPLPESPKFSFTRKMSEDSTRSSPKLQSVERAAENWDMAALALEELPESACVGGGGYAAASELELTGL